MTDRAWPSAIGLATLLGVVGWDFLAATTFIGDDHVFLAFARHAPGPLAPFVADCHGGEYYRPLPMASWWLLARLGGERIFALFALALHATAALLTGRLARAMGASATTAALAGAMFLVAPAERDAALWFSASTDLLATVMTLGSILCLLRGSRASYGVSLVLAGLAYLSKESALVLPALALAAAWSNRHDTEEASGVRVFRLLPHAALALIYLGIRFAILGGLGGAGDEGAPAWGRALQLARGLVHAIVGERFAPAPLLWMLGTLALAWGIAAATAARADRRALFPLLWTALALAPLPAAGWVVGTRYFYLPAVGLALLLARPLAARGAAAVIPAVTVLLALGSAAAVERRAEINEYRSRVDAAAQGVAAGLAGGHRLFHVRAGIKDLDLVLKRRLGEAPPFLVLPDVPASFVLLPDTFASRAQFLLARPPLPPSGAYRFGGRSIVGLARRDESPDLDEVIARLPELRFLELRPEGGGRLGWRDVTDRPRR